MPELIPSLLALLGALFLVVAIASVALVGRFLKGLFGAIPVVGKWLGDTAEDIANLIVNDLFRFYHADIAFLEAMLKDVWSGVEWLIQGYINVLSHLGSQASNISQTQIPNSENESKSYALNHVNALAATVSADVNSLSGRINTEASDRESAVAEIHGAFYNGIEQDIADAESGAYHEAVSYVNTQLQSFSAAVVARFASDEGALGVVENAVSNTIPAEIAADAAKAAADTAAAKASVLSTLNSELSQVEASLEAAINAGNAAAAANLETTREQLQGQIGTLNGEQVIDQANIGTLTTGVDVVIPASIAAVAASLASLATEVAECAVTICDGPNNIESVVQRLLGALTLAGEIGFLAEAIKDPIGTGNTIFGLLDGLYDAGHSELDLLLAL